MSKRNVDSTNSDHDRFVWPQIVHAFSAASDGERHHARALPEAALAAPARANKAAWRKR